MEGQSEFQFAGRVAVVTGGTRGLGRSMANAFHAAGARVVVCGRTQPAELPHEFDFQAVDVRDPDAVRAFVDGVAARHDGLDFVINNAGGSPEAEAATASPRFFDSVVRLNLHSAMFIAQAALPYLKRSGRGSIVNIASVSGIRPSPGTAAYGAAKAGLLNLTQSLAQEWGPDGVRVNAIVVGLVQTEAAGHTYGDSAAQEAVAHTLPLRRMGTGADVAGAALWLCSDSAAWVSGARINVDGGGERPIFLDLVKGKA